MAIRKHLKSTLGSMLGYKKSPITGNSLRDEIDFSKEVFFFQEVKNNLNIDTSPEMSLYLRVDVTGFPKKDLSKLIAVTLKEARKLTHSKTIHVTGFDRKEKRFLHVSGDSPIFCFDCAKKELTEKIRPTFRKYFRFGDLTRKEKISRLAKKLLAYAAVIQFSLPVSAISLNLIHKNNISLEKAKQELKLEAYPISPSTKQEHFLCMANYTVHKAAEQQKSSFWRNPVCEDYARSTKEMYDYIVTKAGKEELKDKVELRIGEVKTEDSMWYHAWLAIENSNRSRSYFEATRDIPDTFGLDFGVYYCLSNNFDIPDWKENYTTVKASKNGILYPTAESLYMPGGGARPIYLIIINFGEIYKMLDIKWDLIGQWIGEGLYYYGNFFKSPMR